MPLTDDDIRLLAWQARRARPHGAPRWDEPGIAAALTKVRHLDLAEVMMATARAARDRDLDTPAAIGNTAAPCWIERPIERWTPDKTIASERCGECSHPRHDGQCPRCPAIDTHDFTPDFAGPGLPADAAARTKQALRAEIRPFGDRPTQESNHA